MSQVGWIYLDDFGHRYKIGLYHGRQSGHLLIYVNKRIVYIDFHVTSTKKYSFYVGEELIEIDLIRGSNNTFEYDFQVNKKIDTPLNRLRAKRDKRDLIHGLLFFAVFLSSIAGIYYILINFGQ